MTNTIQARRKLLGLTQAQFAGKANIPLRTYKRYEADINSNDHRVPDAITAIRIADVLGVSDLRELWGTKCPHGHFINANPT